MTNEENYLLQKLVRVLFRNNAIDQTTRMRPGSFLEGLETAFGLGAMTNSIGEIERARVLLVIGSNPDQRASGDRGRHEAGRTKGGPSHPGRPRKE